MNSEARDRVGAELSMISEGDNHAKLFENPDAVIYYGLPSPLGIVDSTDVLVLVPSGYPGATPDHAYLPSDSKLLGVLKGQPEDVFVDVDARRWKRVSYHPHNGGGAPPWNPNIHGFHTYIDEILTWLSVRR
jgi:hypothetical protein